MESLNLRNAIYTGASGRESLYDLLIPESWNGKLIVFIHGYMGFKDWGCWPLVEHFFVENSYGFLKYNVSHNGATTSIPIDFPDQDAFSMNSYSKELKDFECVIKTATEMMGERPEVYLIGHSRGGGIAALQAHHDLVVKWVSWAGISSISKRFPKNEVLENWKNNTYRYITNSRTNDELPLHFSQYEDYIANEDRLNIEAYCKSNAKPCLIVHGTEDTSVLPEEALELAKWTGTDPLLISATQHTFGASHPWNDSEMPAALQEICHKTLLFFEL